MVIFDTNMSLRYLLNDDQEMANRAEQYLNAGDVHVTIEVIAELVCVLRGVYSLERGQIADTVKAFLCQVQSRDMRVLELALDNYGARSLDFVDCVLNAYHVVKGAELATFDKKLLKLLRQRSE